MEISKHHIAPEEFERAKQPLMRRYLRIRELITVILDGMLRECKFCDIMKVVKDIDHHDKCKACPIHDLCVEKTSLYHEAERSLEKAKTDLLHLYMEIRERTG